MKDGKNLTGKMKKKCKPQQALHLPKNRTGEQKSKLRVVHTGKKLFSSFPSSPDTLLLLVPILPLAVKLFRTTSAARLIKFSFLQITIRKRATLLNHITATSYEAVYLLVYRKQKDICKEKTKAA